MGKLEKSLAEMFSFIFQGDSEYEIYTFPAVILGFAVKAVCGEGKVIGLAMRTRNMRFMQIMRICRICGCGWKISSTLSTYKYLPKMATFWAKNGSAWLCFQFWVPKISLLFIPPGFIHPQEWKLRVQNHKILVKKRWFFFTIDAVYAHWCASDAHRCASAKIGAWPALIQKGAREFHTAKLSWASS